VDSLNGTHKQLNVPTVANRQIRVADSLATPKADIHFLTIDSIPISRLSDMLAEAPALQGTEGSQELAMEGDNTPGLLLLV